MLKNKDESVVGKRLTFEIGGEMWVGLVVGYNRTRFLLRGALPGSFQWIRRDDKTIKILE
jgi:hypothetical protein